MRHRKATNDVHAGKENRGQSTRHAGREQRAVELQHPAHDDDAAYGVGHTDQGCVQGRGDARHGEVTDEARQHEVPDVGQLCLWDVRGQAQAKHGSGAEAQRDFFLVVLQPPDHDAGLSWHLQRRLWRRCRLCRNLRHQSGREVGAGGRLGRGPQQLAAAHDRGGPDDRIFPMLSCEASGAAQRVQQCHEVVAQHLAGLRGHRRRVVRLTNDGDAVGGHDGLVGLRRRAIATRRRGQVHDHGAGPHGPQHPVSEQHGRGPIGDHRGGDHHVHVRENPCVCCELRLLEGLAHLRGIAANALARDANRAHGHELSAHALHLLSRRLAHIIGQDLRAQRVRRGDRAKARDAGANDEDPGGRHRAAGGDRGPAEAREAVEGIDHGAVAGDVRHRGERIQLLCP
mmetsp:Transcript_63963/g.177463  ORF Transcript_63963/g.177463 Transcript_63963/m.177463 type:complete len:399 (-) Transcript_63963:1792-2988(-)